MVIVLAVLGVRSPNFFAINNIFDVLKMGSTLTLIAIGQTIVLVSGGFDMSAGALIQFTCNVSSGMIIANYNPMLAIGACLIIGLIIGVFNSVLVNKIGIPPFVATLSSMFILMGVSLIYNKGQALTFNHNPVFSFLGQGYIGSIPFIFILTLIIILIVNTFLKKTKTGLHMYASGGNNIAAQLKGISSKKTLFISFCFAGLVLGFTGAVQASYNFGASALNTGMDVLISALAAALLGSTFSKTGELSIWGTAISAMFIAALSNGLIINGVSNRAISGILGLILIVSIIPNVIQKRDIGQVTIF
jgi:ribose/xylose/arabinose/galactoside ABC-type transport system permease subunit